MNRVSLLFPGQGSQYVGMGEHLIGRPLFDKRLKEADEILNFPLSQIMRQGPEEKLMLTENTQPALLCYSIALFDLINEQLQSEKIQIDCVLGHSVGEYAALVVAGSLRFEDALRAVRLRGQAMQEAVPAGQGQMLAFLKVNPETIEKMCQQVSKKDCIVAPANYNGPAQIVVSGTRDACQRAIEWAKENIQSSYRVVPLKVSAPFHCPLMMPAQEKMKDYLTAIEMQPNKIPYIANIDAKLYPAASAAETIRENLIQQVTGSVRWLQSVQQLDSQTRCLEVGAGKVLMGLVRTINRDISVTPLDKEQLDQTFWQKYRELS